MLIEAIGRKQKLRRADVVNQLGRENITRIYKCADVLSGEVLETVRDREIQSANIKRGRFDNCSKCLFRLPSDVEIGEVYGYLIDYVCEKDGLSPIDALFIVYNNNISNRISEYNCAAYYSPINEQYRFYKTGEFSNMPANI
jgi:hypothetical protein